MGKGRRGKIFRQLNYNFFYIKKHNRCWTWCRGSGGDPTHPHSFIHTTLTHIAEIWLGLNQQPLNREAALLPLSHRSLVWACAGTYISLFTCMWFYNKLVKALAESLLNQAPLLHITVIWLGSNQQPLNREAALLPVSHRSLVWACAGTYISLFICMILQ